MKPMLLALCAVVAIPVFTSVASAGAVENACLRSDRKAVNRQLCDCIQQVADITLQGSDQRRVATFFKDPEKAQQVRLSKSKGDDAFWDRYRAFSAQAEAYCAG